MLCFPDRMSDNITEYVSNRMSECLKEIKEAEYMPNKMREGMSDSMSNELFEYMLERMPDDMPEILKARI